MEEAEYCDRIMIQDQGKLLAIGAPQEIREKVGTKEDGMNEVFIKIIENARERKRLGEKYDG
jgi:ABC-2 type transport system ATP-binding protein